MMRIVDVGDIPIGGFGPDDAGTTVRGAVIACDTKDEVNALGGLLYTEVVVTAAVPQAAKREELAVARELLRETSRLALDVVFEHCQNDDGTLEDAIDALIPHIYEVDRFLGVEPSNVLPKQEASPAEPPAAPSPSDEGGGR